MDDGETSEQRRERVRQEELKKRPAANLKDASDRANSGSLTDLTGSLGWKGLGLLILLLMAGMAAGLAFF